jgi:hypothetical protein
MLTEQQHLLPLAEDGFDLASLHFPRINASGCVKVLTNFYSAPLPVGASVQAKVYSAYVEIWYQARCGTTRALLSAASEGAAAGPLSGCAE